MSAQLIKSLTTKESEFIAEVFDSIVQEFNRFTELKVVLPSAADKLRNLAKRRNDEQLSKLAEEFDTLSENSIVQTPHERVIRLTINMLSLASRARDSTDLVRVLKTLLEALSLSVNQLEVTDVPVSADSALVDTALYRRGVGDTIARLRKEMHFTQAHLSQRAGISQGTISKLEQGVLGYNIHLLRKVAKGLGVPISSIDPGFPDEE